MYMYIYIYRIYIYIYISVYIYIYIINVLYTLELAGRHSSIWATWCGCPTPSLELANGPGRNCQLHPQIQGWSDEWNLNPSTSDVSFAELVLWHLHFWVRI